MPEGARRPRPDRFRGHAWRSGSGSARSWLHPLIRSPRATKRFVNVYRLLRASHVEPEVGPPDPDGSDESTSKTIHRTALVLLALLTGRPEAAIAFFQWTLARAGGGPTGMTLSQLRADLARFVDEEQARALAAEAGAPPPSQRQPGEDHLTVVPGGEWRLFLGDIDQVARELEERGITFDPDLATMAQWVPRVARYSFRSSQVNGVE